MEPLRSSGAIRYWDPDKGSGLAVVDVPASDIAALGGLKQVRVRGRLGGAGFVSSVMPAGGGRLAMTVSKAMMQAASVRVGDTVEVEITGIGRD